jgi:chromosome segregation ATPase
MASARFVGPTLAGLLALYAVPARAGEAGQPVSRHDSYVLVRGDHGSSISSGSLEDVRATRRRYSGDFLWARRGSREVVIRDSKTLDEAASCFETLRELEPEQQALERRQRDLEKRQNAIDRQQEENDRELDRLSDEDDEDAAAPAVSEEDRRRLEDRRREIESRARELESEERALETEERTLDERSDALEKEAEARLWRLIDRAIAEGRAEGARR